MRMQDPFRIHRRVTGQETHGYTLRHPRKQRSFPGDPNLSGLGGKSVPGKLAVLRRVAAHGQITERKLSVSQASLFLRPRGLQGQTTLPADQAY
jgi:hypothetical protein